MSLAHLRLRINVIICRLFLLAKHHTAPCPVCAESTRLNASQLDVPFRLQLMGQGLGEALDCPFRGAVDAEGGYAALTTNGCDLLDFASRWLVHLAHDLERFASHMDQAKEVDLHLRACLIVRDALELAR